MQQSEDKKEDENRKKIQLSIWWLSPLIAFGGIIWPYIGYIIPFMMLFLCVLSAFKGRFWCGWFCPRGALLERKASSISRKRVAPAFLRGMMFRSAFLLLFMGVMIIKLIQTGGMPEKIGLIFATSYLFLDITAVFLGIIFMPRTWCTFCPMGTLQGMIGKDKYLLHVSEDCFGCGLCEKVCPVKTYPGSFKGKVRSEDCIRCSNCVLNCPRKALRFE
jgi:polyferredoxin